MPTLLLTAIEMPANDGHRASRRGSERCSRAIRVVMMTADFAAPKPRAIGRTSSRRVLLKPITIGELLGGDGVGAGRGPESS